MSYFTGMVAAVPVANRRAYIDHARQAWPVFARLGARRMVETWAEDVRPGRQTDFLRAVQAGDGEAVVFSWIEWPDRATADAAWTAMTPGDMPEMPFDGSRMIWGGFAPLFTAGKDRGGYYQGFLTPVPAANRVAYRDLAQYAWDNMFAPHGALGAFENWGEDVPHGKKTDMYRATDAAEGEAILFSWTVWPDRASCDAAARAMEADHPQAPADMPFDGMRMIWGGFSPIFDSADLSDGV
ncbi:MAG: DUF1428 domain-containing protein [Paracoccus sp. (in: a-proteobacteria)]|nr:DUF1428 domain-containing protein [Paracoccus sp. (in: a-proteobacteria)]